MRRTVRISAQPPTRAAAHYRRPTRAPAEVGICGSHRKEINTGPRDLSTNFRRRRDAAVTISLFTRAHDTMLARVAMAQCLCLSVTSRCSVEMDGRIELVFGVYRLLSTYPSLCYKEIQVSTKINVLPSGTLSQIPDLENFASAYRSSKCVINLARERWTLRA